MLQQFCLKSTNSLGTTDRVLIEVRTSDTVFDWSENFELDLVNNKELHFLLYTLGLYNIGTNSDTANFD